MLTRLNRDDRGFALVVTLVALFTVLLLLSGVLSYAVGSQNISHHDQNWNAALSAAEAGIDDYLYRLNQDGSYWQYGNNIAAPASCASTGVALPNGSQPVNPAFTTWVQVPGGSTSAWYRYQLTCRPGQTTNGTVAIASTGRVGNVTRTVSASLRKRNFLDFLYFTEYETKDPLLYSTQAEIDWATVNCARHVYDNPARDVDCTDITFISSDSIDGPLHSNDAILINGSPHFGSDTSTSLPYLVRDPYGVNKRYLCNGTPCTPSFTPSTDPRLATALHTPPSNEALIDETNPALGGTGCLFTGPTAITLRNVGNVGVMDVISPFSQNIYCTWPHAGTWPMYGQSTSTRFTLPPEGGVVYVQTVPTAGDNAGNGCQLWDGSAWQPVSRPAIGGSGGSGNTPSRAHPLGFPQKNDITPKSTDTSIVGYGCRNGDAFVQGELNGRLTIGAQNNIILVGSTIAGADDLLGLVANNFIYVYHPVANTTGNPADYVAPVTPVNEQQTITLTSWGSGDSFTLTYCNLSGSCQTTGPIVRGSDNTATSTNIRNALGPLVGGVSNIAVVGSGTTSTRTFVVTFQGTLAATDVTPTMALSRMAIPTCSGCGGSVGETRKGVPANPGDPSTLNTCSGTQDNYCNLRIPSPMFSSTSSGASMATTTSAVTNVGPTIDAALLTVRHSFTVQNHNRGPDFGTADASKLKVYGAIAQLFRGVVGTFNGGTLYTGYSKSYSYNDRLKYDSPPKFLDPIASQWQVVTWAEQRAAYAASAP